MRTTDERIAELNRRMGNEKQKKKRLRYRVTVLSSFAACFVLLIGVSIFMPGLNASFVQSGYHYAGPAASVFYEGGALGYVLIALFSFILGVCFTILCYLLRRKAGRDKENSDD